VFFAFRGMVGMGVLMICFPGFRMFFFVRK
jgi:hypothetical protein